MQVARNVTRDDTSAAMTHASAGALERRRARAAHLLFHAPPGREVTGEAGVAGRVVWKKIAARTLIALAPVAVLVLAIIGAGFADCRTSIGPATPAGEVQAIMEIGAARSCVLRLPAAPETIQDLVVADPPRSGTLTIRGRSGVVYHATNDFDGADAFGLIIRARPAPGGAQVMKISVRIGAR